MSFIESEKELERLITQSARRNIQIGTSSEHTRRWIYCFLLLGLVVQFSQMAGSDDDALRLQLL